MSRSTPHAEPHVHRLNRRYRVERVVARDGDAAVWAGRDELLDRPVCVRIEPLGERPPSVFLEAAGASSVLRHPNIAPVLDAGVEDGSGFVVLETMPQTLAGDGVLSAAAAVRVGLQLCAAAERAERAGVRLAELDPENVVVREVGRDGPARIEVLPAVATGRGGGVVDAASIAALLRRLLAGRRVGPEVELRRLRPGVPRSLDAALLGAMGEPGTPVAVLRERLAATDVEDDAIAIGEHSPTPPRGVRPVARHARRPRLVGGAVAVVAAAALAIGAVAVVRSGLAPSGGDSAGATAALARADIAQVVAFDPEGDGREHDRELPLLVDGDPRTTWTTDRYRTPAFGGLKSGVGVVVVLTERHDLEALSVDAAASSWTASVHVAAAPGRTLTDWGDPVATIDTSRNGGRVRVPLRARDAGAVLVWFTDLGPARRASVGELTPIARG